MDYFSLFASLSFRRFFSFHNTYIEFYIVFQGTLYRFDPQNVGKDQFEKINNVEGITCNPNKLLAIWIKTRFIFCFSYEKLPTLFSSLSHSLHCSVGSPLKLISCVARFCDQYCQRPDQRTHLRHRVLQQQDLQLQHRGQQEVRKIIVSLRSTYVESYSLGELKTSLSLTNTLGKFCSILESDLGRHFGICFTF